MRDYSKPPYDIPEMSAVYIGICKTLNKSCSFNVRDYSDLPVITNKINGLLNEYKSPIRATSDAGRCGIAMQSLIDILIVKGISTMPELDANVFPMFDQLPESLFIDRITGKKKFNW